MTLTTWFAIGALMALTACARSTLEQQIVNEAAAALGGAERLHAVRIVSQEGEGVHYYLGQDVRPNASEQTFAVTAYKRVIDVPGRRARTELRRTANFPYFQGQAPQRQVQGIDGEVGYNVGASGNATRIATQAALDRRAELYHFPLTLVRAALAPSARLANARTDGKERLVDITIDDDLQFVLAIDEAGRPTRVESRGAHPNLGDVTLSTLFVEYGNVAGLMLPTHLTTKVDGFTTTDMRFATQAVDGEVADLTAPQTAASAAPSPVPPRIDVVVEDVSPGVWRLAGQSHYSALVEFADHLMLIDAPLSEARALATIAVARELRPEKPLTTLVTTHHHFDHTGGVRAAIAEGLTVITHSGNRAFFEEIAGRPHTIVPDALAKRPAPLRLETVDDELRIEDATRTVVLYHIGGHPHSETMLMAYLPRERVLVEVDTFIPHAPSNPYIVRSATNMLENIKKRGLRVDRIVPLHFTIEPFAALVKAAAQTN